MPKTLRLQRYKDFQAFLDGSNDFFADLAKSDSGNDFFGGEYSLCIKPGGAAGGRDKRLLEVFYGKRPFDSIEEVITSTDGGLPRLQKRLLSENGVRLNYYLNDSGVVVCSLIPARTDSLSQREDAIILDSVSNPSQLRILAKSHWNYFQSYMQVTSLDGAPTFADKIRVFWLRLCRLLIVSGKQERRRILVISESVLKFTASVGLSGFLLLAITRYFDKPPTAQLTAEISQLRSEQMRLQRDLGQAQGVAQALQRQFTSLRYRFSPTEKLSKK